MKKILFITSLSGKTINGFMRYAIFAANSIGYEFHLAANFDNADLTAYQKQAYELGVFLHHIPFKRSPFNLKNFYAKNELETLIKNVKFDVVHCNTPIGGVIGRIVCKKFSLSSKVVYTAHGFHFFKGSNFLNWLFYYPVEKYLGKFTQLLITINNEDFAAAKKYNICKKIILSHGVGIDSMLFKKQEVPLDFYKKYNIPLNKKIVLSVGELIKRKNHSTFLKIAKKVSNNKVHFVLCGRGREKEHLLAKARRMGLTSDFFTLIDYIPFDKINLLFSISSIFCFPTFQEGLPGVLLEAMSVGLPAVVSNIRGNNDLIVDGKGGFLHNPNDVNSFVSSINFLLENENVSNEFALFNKTRASLFDIQVSKNEISKVYKDIGGYEDS